MARKVNRAAVVGLGLIGGSLAMAWTQGKAIPEVVGVDLDPESLEIGVETGAIHRGETDLEKGIRHADLIVLAMPVGQMRPVMEQLRPHLRPGMIVTDVGSTKADFVKYMEDNFAGVVDYVGGHPMTGSERGGIEAADKYLFENAVYLLTPTAKTNPEALETVSHLVRAAGARVVTIDPEEHDLMVAAVSHLPHLVAVALVNTVGNLSVDHPQALMLAAGGFRDTTRVAMGDPVMWRDICLTNRDRICEMIRRFRVFLDQIETSVLEHDTGSLMEDFRAAKETRMQIPAKMKGFLPGIFELVVTVPDRPGMIADIARILGAAGINIADIEILRIREGEGGTIRLGFQSEEAVQLALVQLRQQGIIAKQR
ncbi:MAG: prephenate dehydrogenase/arogenate dehydrogenase family protein [Bacillota bacterium]